jgi:Protein of unknown function (DUF2785)
MSLCARFAALALALCASGASLAACPPDGHTRASLDALKAAQWRVGGADPDAARRALAVGLLDCLADPDPALRDEIAFEALQAWMRGRALDTATVQALRLRLMATLAAPADAAGFAQPFAALVLAEVARVDRLQPYLDAAERAAVVDAATRYVSGVRDYRGFDAREGWRHGVAHGADLMLQLSLNPQLLPAQAGAMLDAIATQVMPPGAQFYRYGEPSRLAAPVFWLGRRDSLSAAQWQAWFDALMARQAPTDPPTDPGLAQRHNLAAFVSALYVSVQEQGDAAQRERMLPALRKALGSLR